MAYNPHESLDSLRELLLAIPASDVRSPDVRMAVYHQDTNDLATVVAAPVIAAKLQSVGIASDRLESLPVALDACRMAQSQWVVANDRGKPEAQKEREELGYAHRSEVVAACRWNLRDNRTAMATLGVIAEGDGIPDLIQDLRDVAVLAEANVAAFEKDESFDAPAAIETCRSLASDITAGQSAFATSAEAAAARDLRDRAYTWLWGIDADVRAAGRYAFRNDPEQVSRFYRPRRQTPAKKAEPTT